MTINRQNVLQIFQSNGGRTYSVGFRVFKEAPFTDATALVYLKGAGDTKAVLQIEGTDYNISKTNDEAFTINFMSDIPPGLEIIVTSGVPYRQPNSFPKNQLVDPEINEQTFDILELQIQQLLTKLDTKIGYDFPDNLSAPKITLARPVDDKLLQYKADGSGGFILEPTTVSATALTKDAQDAKTAAQEAKDASRNAQTAATTAQSATATAQTAATQAQGAKNAAEQIKIDVTNIQQDINNTKTDIDAKAQQVATDRQTVQNLVNRIPDPTGEAAGKAILTDGQDAYHLVPIPVVENLQTATRGSTIIVEENIQGDKYLTASSAIVGSTQQIATTFPNEEGGVDASQSNMNQQAMINALMNKSGLRPWGIQNIAAEFIVQQDASLVSTYGGYHLQPNNARNAISVLVNGIRSYYGTASDYDIPPVIGTAGILNNPFTIIFVVRPTSLTTDFVVIDKPDFRVEYQASSQALLFSDGALIIPTTLTLKINEWNFVAVTYQNNSLDLFVTTKATSTTVSTVSSIGQTHFPIAAGGFAFNTGPEFRAIYLIILNKIITQADLESFASYILTLSPDQSGVPPASSGQQGQALVVNSGGYSFANVISLDTLPSGYTLDFPRLDLSLVPPGEHNLVIKRDDTAQKFTVALSEVDNFVIRTGITKVISMVPKSTGNTPIEILPENPARYCLVIQNRLDASIIVGDLAALTTDNQNGMVVGAGMDAVFISISAHHALALSTTIDAVGVLEVVELIKVKTP